MTSEFEFTEPGNAATSGRGAMLTRPSGQAGVLLLALVCGVAAFAPVLTQTDPYALSGPPLTAPSPQHLMGTDALGRDLFSGVLYGARTSLGIALGVTALTFLCGMSVGLVGGYRGGRIDALLMRVTELLQVLPRFFLVLVAVALIGSGPDRLILVLGVTSWPVLARVVRGDVLRLRASDFVVAARAAGASNSRVLVRNLLPNVLPNAIAITGLVFGQIILIEASLGFLGFGDPSAMSWGLLAAQAQPLLRVAWWLALFPGLAISVTVLGVNLAADAYLASRDRR